MEFKIYLYLILLLIFLVNRIKGEGGIIGIIDYRIVENGYNGIGCLNTHYLKVSDPQVQGTSGSGSNLVVQSTDTSIVTINSSRLVTAHLSVSVIRIDTVIRYGSYNNISFIVTLETSNQLLYNSPSITCVKPTPQIMTSIAVRLHSIYQSYFQFLVGINVAPYYQSYTYNCSTSLPNKFFCLASPYQSPRVNIIIYTTFDTINSTGSYTDTINITLVSPIGETINLNVQPFLKSWGPSSITFNYQYPSGQWDQYVGDVNLLMSLNQVQNASNARYLSSYTNDKTSISYPVAVSGDDSAMLFAETHGNAGHSFSMYQLSNTNVTKVQYLNPSILLNYIPGPIATSQQINSNDPNRVDVIYSLYDFSSYSLRYQNQFDYPSIAYPYGINKRVNETLVTFKSTVTMSRASKMIVSLNQYGQTITSSYALNKNDITPPQLLSIKFKPTMGFNCIVTMSIYDGGSGLKYIQYMDTKYFIDRLIDGSSINGTYMFEVLYQNYNPNITIILCDNDMNSINIDPNSYNIDMIPLPSTNQFNLTIDDITYFRFFPYEIDTSNSTNSIQLLLNTSKPLSYAVNLKIMLSPLQSLRNYGPLYILAILLWSPNDNMYRSTIQVPRNTGNMTSFISLDMIADQGLNQQLYDKFGIVSKLKLTSKFLDNLPPFIESIIAYPFQNSTILADTQIGFNITIVDSINGLASGSIQVQSSLNGQIYTIPFTTSDRVGGDAYRGDYMIPVTTVKNQFCQKVKYTIIRVVLFDVSSQSVLYPQTSGKTATFDPFFKVRQNTSNHLYLTTTCSTISNDYNPPIITNFTISPTITDLYQSSAIYFEIHVQDVDSGISSTMFPSITLWTDYGDSSIIPLSSIPFGNGYKYMMNTTLGWGFGKTGLILVSVNGISDNNGNIRSYSSIELDRSGWPSYINVTNTYPYLSGIIPTLDGGFNFRGTNFGNDTSQITAYCTFSNTTFIILPVTFVNYIELLVSFPSYDGSLVYFSVSRLGLYSQKYGYLRPVTPTAIVIPNDPVQCTNECNGRGDCTFDGCSCYPPWYGPDCLSSTIPVNPPQQNTTDPTVVIIDNGNITNGGSLPVRSIISIYSIRELDIQGTIVNNYQFNNWTVSIQPNQYNSTTNYLYNTILPSTNTTINVTIQWFEVSTSIPFAGDIIQVTPYTSKFSVSLSPYPFREAFNTLQIIFKTEYIAQGSQCSSKQYGLGNGNDQNDLQWMKLKIDDKSVYGQFIRRGIVDGRNSIVKNVLLDQEFNSNSTSSSTESFIGINIPKYSKSVQLDPSFANLIDVDGGDNSNQVCGNNKSKSGLSNGVIAAIVVASIVAASLVIGSIMLIKKKVVFAKHEKNVNMKLNKM